MSDLMLAILIVASIVVGGLVALAFFLGRSEKAEVAKLLTQIKCPCGHSPLVWKSVWLVHHHQMYPESDSKEADQPSSERVRDNTGYGFECPKCQDKLLFDRAGELYQLESK